jgi:hypothetical protein
VTSTATTERAAAWQVNIRTLAAARRKLAARTPCPGCQGYHDIDRLAWAVWVLDDNPDLAGNLTDDVLAVLWQWTGGTNAVLGSEVRRRRDIYLERAARFNRRVSR